MKQSVKSVLIFILIFFPFPIFLFSLDFSISPNSDGTMDVFASLDWEYAPHFYSGLEGKYTNVGDTSETASQYVATSGTILALGADILGYRIRRKNSRLDVSLNLQYQDMDIREIGYIDSGPTRYFVLNDRNLRLFLPRIKGLFSSLRGGWKFSLGGEYSPWLHVDLDQVLTVSPGLEEVPYRSSQSAINAFSVNSSLRFMNPLLTPQISVVFDQLGIRYGINTAGGETVIDTLLQTLSGEVMLVFSAVNLSGVHPTAALRNDWDWTTDRAAGGSAELVSGFQFTFGFEL